MGAVKIVNKVYARYETAYRLHELKDFREIKLTPQEIVPGIALKPEFSFVFGNSEDRLFIIHISLASDGKYYFGYSIYLDFGQRSCHPSVGHKYLKCADTLLQCIMYALEHCMNLSAYQDTPADRRLVKAVNDAMRELKSYRLRQLTIFDML